MGGQSKDASEMVRHDIVNRTGAAIIIGMVLGISVVLYAFWSHQFFRPDGIGVDNVYNLPRLLSGDYWIANNGITSFPQFLPGFCGGFPYLANPQSLFLSIPQFAFYFWPSEQSLYYILLVFAAAGALGTFLICRSAWRLSLWASALAFNLSLWNGFLTYRLVIGHLSFHAFGLLPLAIFAALPVDLRRSRILIRIVSLAAFLIYAIESGCVIVLGPALVTIALCVGLTHLVMRRDGWEFLLQAAGITFAATGLALCVSAGKIAEMQALLSNFTRGHLVLASNFWHLFGVIAEGFFLPALLPNAGPVALGLLRHEFEFGVSLVPIVVLILALLVFYRRAAEDRAEWVGRLKAWSSADIAAATIVGLCTICPLALNLDIHLLGWREILEHIPYIKNYVHMNRWLAAWIIPIILITAKLLHSLKLRHRYEPGLALGLSVFAIIQFVTAPTGYYAKQIYNPTGIREAAQLLKQTGRVPAIDSIKTPIHSGPPYPYSNEGVFILGASAVPCYEPMLGYIGQAAKDLAPGPIRVTDSNRFNVANPICALFGPSNRCSPGDRFKADEEQKMRQFLSYHPIQYVRPQSQIFADCLSVVATFCLSIMGCIAFGRAIFRR